MRAVRFVTPFLLATVLAGCSLFWPGEDSHELQFDGTVTFIMIEGGAWVIESDAGTTYEAINLDEDYEVEGLRVRVWADEREDLGSFLMVGPIIEIERIRRL